MYIGIQLANAQLFLSRMAARKAGMRQHKETAKETSSA